jgi:glycosyltransferase involved in cell wall biosynthesis
MRASRPFNVLMLGWEFPPHTSGGLGTACHGLAQALGRQGAEVLFVVPHARPAQAAGGLEVRGARAAQAEPRSSVEIVRVASPLAPYADAREYARRARRDGFGPPNNPYGMDLFREVHRYALVVREIALSRRFDLVHAHDWMSVPAALSAQERSGLPLLWHVHACEHDRSPLGPDPLIHAVEQEGLDQADRVVTVSRYMAGRLAALYRVATPKLRVVHNAVDAAGAPPPERTADGRPTVLFLGRVTHQKGPFVFLEAAARVARELPEARFVVAGHGDLFPSMVERAAELGLARSVRFTGFLEPADVRRAYARADVFVLPSVSEPFGIAPLEAIAADVPVIVSRAAGVSEVLGSSLKFEPGDVEGLADRILALLSRPALRRELVEGGRRELASIHWDDRARALLSIYREIAA